MRALVSKLSRGLLVGLRIIPRPDLLARLITEHPSADTVKPGVVYVVGGPGYQKWAYFRCPADTEEIIQLSLMPSRRPRWEVKIDLLERPTISPSVRQLAGAYAHFWVRKGRVEWCPDTGRQPSSRSRPG